MKIRAGSLIQYLVDGDVGIVLQLLDKESDEDGRQAIAIWWCHENAEKRIGIDYFTFEPFGKTVPVTVLRY
jgi:hypothetical protein